MRTKAYGLLGLAVVLTLATAASGQDETVDNPKYKFWAGHKKGTTATYDEVTTYTGVEKESVPGGKEVKVIVYELLNVSKDKVVVKTTVTEEEYLGWVEHAPTKTIYLSKIKKAHLEAVFQEFGAKDAGEETVKVGKEEIKCKVLSGTQKKEDTTITYKLYYSDSVPGGIVKRTRVTKSGDKFGAETTVTLRSFNVPKAAPPKDKDKAKDKGKEKDKEKDKG